MTDKEKLNKCIEFIKNLQKRKFKTVEISDVSDYEATCDECGSDFCEITFHSKSDAEFVEMSEIDRLKDEAWHLLADISE